MTTTSGTSSARIAGLDGLRGVAVAMVLAYHLWPWLLPGGYLGVTLFFALSGFLMVRLLRREREGTGRIDLRAYYRRRIRRLLPLALVVLAVVTVVWSVTGWMTGDLRRELRFTVVQLANWGQLTSGLRYGVSSEPSPVVHYWSLAIEEQVYLLLPLVVLAIKGRRALTGVVVAGLLVSVLLTARSAGDAVVVYYSTFTRMGEVLIGALVALLPFERVRRLAPLLAVAGLVALAAMGRVWSLDVGVMYRGGLLVAGATAALVVGAVSVAPRLGRALDVRPMAWLGTVSYGVYLIHWPLLIGLGATRLPGWSVPWATLGATLVLAAISARWLERPLQRTGAGRAVRTGVVARVLAGAAVVTLTLPMLVTVPSPVPDFEAASAEFDAAVAARVSGDGVPSGPRATEPGSATATLPAPTVTAAASPVPDSPVPDSPVTPSTVTPPTVTPSTVGTPTMPASSEDLERPLVFGYFGDSKALALALGAARRPPAGWALGPSFVRLACPLGRGGDGRSGNGIEQLGRDDCDWTGFVGADQYDEGPIDVAVVWFGTWDILDRQVPALGPGWWSLDDDDYRRWLHQEWEALVTGIVDSFGARVVLILTLPEPDVVDRPDRISVWNRLLDDFARTTAQPVEVLDIAGWVAATGESDRLLPDGVHATFDGAGGPNTGAELHERFVGPRADVIWRHSSSR